MPLRSFVLCLALLLALFSSASPAMARSIQFVPSQTFASGATFPNRIVVADLNGDGIPDLVVNDSFNIVAVFIGKGDGTFNSPTIYTLDFYVTGSVAIADFNGDHKLDLAVVGGDTAGNGLALLTGNGDGTFNPPVYMSTILAGAALVGVAGDFNNDGNADIFIGGNGSSELILGDGTGHFSEGQFQDGISGDGVAVGDFNHDGNLDVAASNLFSDTVAILLGNGDGTFQAPTTIGGINAPIGMMVADVNRDGVPDLAVAVYNDSSVLILLGNGDGTFTKAQEWFAGTQPGSVVAGDFNLDGNIDLAASDFGGAGASVLPGRGDGTFPFSFYYPTGNQPAALAVGDFNRDGSLDVAVVNYGDTTVSILLNAAGTSVQLSSSANPSHLGQPVRFTAAVASSVGQSGTPGGAITFKDGPKILGSAQLTQGKASLAVPGLAKGLHKITANYSGDTTFNPSKSAVLTQDVK